MNKKNLEKYILKLVAFVVLTSFMVFHSYYLTQMYSLDEVWNYGFSLSILNGLVPYVDFSMIVPPLFPYLGAVFLGIFGKNLLMYHILIAIICAAIVFISYPEMGWNAISIYILLLIYATNGYNTFSLLLLFLLLKLSCKQDRCSAIISAILISCMILTKHSFCVMVIPSLFYNRYKKETLLIYLIAFLGFLGYLVLLENLFEFIDYCLLGMSQFASLNVFSTDICFIIEIIVLIILATLVLRFKGKKKDIFYVLMYQVVAFPITDTSHFVLSWSATIYLIFKYRKYLKEYQGYISILFFIFHLFMLFVMDYNYSFKEREYYENFPTESFMQGRLVPSITKNYLQEIADFRQQYPDYNLYVFGNYGYIVKMYLKEDINRYDLINNGNMGKKGSSGYIEEIDKFCQKNKCLFIVHTIELNGFYYNQTSIELLQYPMNNFKNVKSSLAYSIYMN